MPRRSSGDIEKEGQNLRWLIYKQPSKKFPFQLYIEESPGHFKVLDVQNRWPGPGKKIYCIFSKNCSAEELPDDEPEESCFIKKLGRYGKKLNIVLDRKTKKRCWFLFIKKEYKTKPGQYYEQIFWITRSSAVKKRPGAYIPKVKQDIFCTIVIDKRERYPYKFGYAEVKKENLPVGDYALIKEGKIVAVVERKTLDNLLHEIGCLDALQATLEEMSIYPYKAVVFESPFSDFMNPKKIKPYRAGFVADILIDLAVKFPQIQFIFCENRRFAQTWVYRWFLRINSKDD